MFSHRLCKQACNGWKDYLAGKMGVDRFGVDCSCGCRYFIELDGQGDWGVCQNPKSPRSGLLTWEHMGCLGGFKGDV